MTVQLDKSKGGTMIAEVEFNMADFIYGEYKYRTLNLVKCEENTVIDINPEETWIEIGLKGTKQDGLVQKRMSAIKNQMDNSIKDILKTGLVKQDSGEKKNGAQLKNLLGGVQS